MVQFRPCFGPQSAMPSISKCRLSRYNLGVSPNKRRTTKVARILEFGADPSSGRPKTVPDSIRIKQERICNL